MGLLGVMGVLGGDGREGMLWMMGEGAKEKGALHRAPLNPFPESFLESAGITNLT